MPTFPARKLLHSLIFTIFLSLSGYSLFAQAQETIQLTPEEKAFIQAHPVIRVGIDMDWRPVQFMENGKPSGLTSDYLRIISERTGLQIEAVSGYSWEELFAMLIQQKLDLLPALSRLPSRVNKMHFTYPYMEQPNSVFTRANRTDIKSMADLAGKVVAMPKGYAFQEAIERDYPEVRVLLVNYTEEAIKAAQDGRADAYIGMVEQISKEKSDVYLVPRFEFRLGTDRTYMAVRKGAPVLVGIINKAMLSITAEEVAEISQRWSGVKIYQGDEITRLGLSGAEQTYLQKKQTITACIAPKQMPYEAFVDGKPVGMVIDYLDYFASKIKVPINVIKTATWAQSVELVRQRKCDLLPLAIDTLERQKFLIFTRPYLTIHLALASRVDGQFYDNYSDLNGKKIGYVKGYAIVENVQERYPGIDFIEYDSFDEGLDNVIDGELHGFLDILAKLNYHIQREFPHELKIGGQFYDDIKPGVMVRSDEPLLASVFTKAIESIPEQLKTQTRQNWLSVRYEKTTDYKLIGQLLSVFAVIMVLLFWRYRQLNLHRKEIAVKNAELAMINERLHEQKNSAQYTADHDLLTGLPNRNQLLSRLEHALNLASRQNSRIAVLFMDLDKFKYINDSLGHHVGDEFLREIGKKIQTSLRESDTLARIGGDEFIIMLESVDDEESVAIVAQDIINILRQPHSVMDYSLSTTVSIGIALYPKDADNVHALIKYADTAMYKAKEQGRDRFFFYTRDLSEKTQKRLQIEEALRQALAENQFSLNFQPIVDLRQGRVHHAEALIRWRHPELGMIPPDDFIPVAEENGLIHEIGLRVFREACRCFLAWREAGLALNSVSVNVSSIQFEKGDLIHHFKAILKEFELPANCVDIEITERYLMEETNQKNRYLETLKQAGHNIAVDDFGVGYSSMSYMKQLPLNTIKIDRSFINDIPHDNNDMQITQAIIALSSKLGYTTTAEGVEDIEQVSFLRQTTCTFAQGYYFSRPVPHYEFIECVKALNQRLQTQDEELTTALGTRDHGHSMVGDEYNLNCRQGFSRAVKSKSSR